jgi:hypothetical protein
VSDSSRPLVNHHGKLTNYIVDRARVPSYPHFDYKFFTHRDLNLTKVMNITYVRNDERIRQLGDESTYANRYVSYSCIPMQRYSW